MKIIDLYTPLQAVSQTSARGYSIYEQDPTLQPLLPFVRQWGMDIGSTREWLRSDTAQAQLATARSMIKNAQQIAQAVEQAFGYSLPGRLILAPSYGEFDGFARYDSGEHNVLLGIDFPDADDDYLRALTAHELSHVYRDHAPATWAHLGKPLAQVTRAEYLEAATAQEHLVSEGLATLFSQALFPNIPSVTHHYYEPHEWQWCETHANEIHDSLEQCLRGDGNVWSYYSESRVAPGSPSRTHYYWASKRLGERVAGLGMNRLEEVVSLHHKPTVFFGEFSG